MNSDNCFICLIIVLGMQCNHSPQQAQKHVACKTCNGIYAKFPQHPMKDVANSRSLQFFKISHLLSIFEGANLSDSSSSEGAYDFQSEQNRNAMSFSLCFCSVETYQCIHLTSWQHLTLQTLAHPKL